MSEISYFHVGKITMDDIQPCVQRMYQLAETDKADSQVELEEQRSKAKEAISEVLVIGCMVLQLRDVPLVIPGSPEPQSGPGGIPHI